MCNRLDRELVITQVADRLDLKLQGARENFRMPLVSEIRAVKSQLLAIMTIFVTGKHHHYKCVNEMIHMAIMFPLKPLGFQHMVITR